MELSSYAHGRGQLSIHFVFVPKYRRHAFAREDIRQHLDRLFREIAAQRGYKIHAMEVMPDHVHMFVELPPSVSVSEAFRLLKGRSSHMLFSVFPELRYMFRRGALWSEGKFFRSVGAVRADVVVDYIRKQTRTTSYKPTGRLKFFDL
jgi:putative transposase